MVLVRVGEQHGFDPIGDGRNGLRGQPLESQKDENRHDCEPGDESPPQADDAHLHGEAEEQGDGQTDNSIPDNVGQECESGIRSAAKRSDTGGLQAVGELKEAGDKEERNRCRNDVRLIGEHPREERRNGDEEQRSD